jgi:hypothetical protein
LATGEDRHVLHADGVHERVGMAVHQPPLRSFAPEDQGHAQRPVLVRQAADLAVLSLDRSVQSTTKPWSLDGGRVYARWEPGARGYERSASQIETWAGPSRGAAKA